MSSDAKAIVLQQSGQKASRSIRQEAIGAAEVAHRRTLLGFGAGVLAGAAGGLLLSRVASDDALGGALAGAVLAVPSAAFGIALGEREHPAWRGALAGAAVDGAALQGAAWGAVSGGLAAHVSRRHWTPVRTPRAAVGIGPTKGRGVVLFVRLAF